MQAQRKRLWESDCRIPPRDWEHRVRRVKVPLLMELLKEKIVTSVEPSTTI